MDSEELIKALGVIGHLSRRVRALKTPSARESDSWFFNLTYSIQAKEADEKLSRALADLGRMADAVKTTLDFLQFGAAQRQQKAAERLQRRSNWYGDFRPSRASGCRVWREHGITRPRWLGRIRGDGLPDGLRRGIDLSRVSRLAAPLARLAKRMHTIVYPQHAQISDVGA